MWSLCCVMLLVSFGCKDSSKSDGSAGRSGSNARAGHSGTTGQDAGTDSGEADQRDAGTGGKAGAAGSGKGGQGADDEDSGLPDSGVSGASDSGDAAYDQCLNDAASAGQTVDDCTHCLCQADKCQAELNVATHDAKANIVVICSEEKKCTDLCCLCENSSCDLSNYATGPCAAEVESAAGVTPGKGVLANGSTVSSKCARDAKDDNSCRRVALLARCELKKCPDACPTAKTCQ
jgi:hypothetical protein